MRWRGFAAVAALALVLALASTWLPYWGAGAAVEEAPRLEGYVMVYVNGELRAVSKMRSFTGPVPAMLALALFPTSKLRNVTVEYWAGGSTDWPPPLTGRSRLNLGGGGYVDVQYVPYKDLSTSPPTFGLRLVVPFESVWGFHAGWDWGFEPGNPPQARLREGPMGPSPQTAYLYAAFNTAINGVTVAHLPPPSPAFYHNETHVLMVFPVTVAIWEPEGDVPERVYDIVLMRGTGFYKIADIRVARDVFDPPVKVYAGDVVTFVYVFAFKGRQVFTENWVKAFAAWLYNSRTFRVTATDGSTVPLGPRPFSVNYTCYCWYGTTAEDAEPATFYFGYYPSDWVTCPLTYNGKPFFAGGCQFASIDVYWVPSETYVVLGDGLATFSRTAYRVQHEIARVEPNVTFTGGKITVSAAFVFDRDATVTEAAVYTRLRHGKEVMLLYYVFPRPVKVKAGQPFTVEFSLDIPYSGGV